VSVDPRILKKCGRVVADAANAVRYLCYKNDAYYLWEHYGSLVSIGIKILKILCDKKIAYN